MSLQRVLFKLHIRPLTCEQLRYLSARSVNNHPVTKSLENPEEPLSVFVVHQGRLVPISNDADRIFCANPASVELITRRHVLSNSSPSKVSVKSRHISPLSDTDGVLSTQCIRLSMAEQIKHRHSELVKLAGSTNQSQTVGLLSYSDLASSAGKTDAGKTDTPDGKHEKNLPSAEQLESIKKEITEMMPHFFRKTHHFRLYSPDVVFENNYWGQNKIIRGINGYAWELLKLRLKCNLAFCNINLYIINITAHPDDGTIRVRWTMKAIPQLQGFMFWKWNLFNIKGKGGVKDKMRDTFRTYDGFNIFWLNSSGAIFKHRLDKVIPDEERKVASSSAEKLSKIMTAKSLLNEASSSQNK